MEPGIIDLVSFDQGFAWQHWAVWYFLLIGSAASAALVGFMAYRRGDGEAIVPALFAAAALGITGPFPLLADLHQPARFMHFYLTLAPNSVMWWGAWFLPAFIVGVAVLSILYSPYGQRFAAYRRAAWYWTAVFAVAVLGYTASEMTIVRARPIWHEAFFPVLLTLSAFASGAGSVCLTAALRGEAPGLAPRTLAVASALFVLGIALWVLTGPSGGFAELALNVSPVSLLVVMTVICGIGGAILAIANLNAVLSAVAGLLGVIGALIFRWELFMGAQAQLKTEASVMPYSFFTNGEALAGLIGTIGLLAVVAAVLVFIIFRGDVQGQSHKTPHTAQ